MKDLYEDLIRFYEFQLGKLPAREEFRRALEATFTPQDLRIFFILPFLGMVTQEKFEGRARKAGLTVEELLTSVKRLQPEGLVDTYVGPQGRVYGRAPIIALLEFQVRVKVASPLREVCTKVMNAFIEGATDKIPTRTPYYRVLPVEGTLTGPKPGHVVAVNAPVPDSRQVLPIDMISEMVRKEPLIAVSDCYCRATKRLVGEDCGHPLETCFYFNELALLKLETGYARKVDYDEAMRILYDCEKAGLVHNVSNCEGKIQTLCNCCACSCGVLRANIRGQTNTAAPSRFKSVLVAEKCDLSGKCVEVCPMDVFEIREGKNHMHEERCIGCGQCVAVCPSQALYLAPREKPPRTFSTNDKLFQRINMEALVGLALRKVTGK